MNHRRHCLCQLTAYKSALVAFSVCIWYRHPHPYAGPSTPCAGMLHAVELMMHHRSACAGMLHALLS
eukprot:731090-Pelagomonas_calceolata.AAC.1